MQHYILRTSLIPDLPGSQCLFTNIERVRQLWSILAPQNKQAANNASGVRRQTRTEIHDVVPADSAVLDDDVWRKQEAQ